MAKPAEERRNQAQQRWPGAAVIERGKGYIKHLHPDDFAAGMQPDERGARVMFDTQVGAKWHYGAGQYIDIQVYQNSGGSLALFSTNNLHNYVAIEKVG